MLVKKKISKTRLLRQELMEIDEEAPTRGTMLHYSASQPLPSYDWHEAYNLLPRQMRASYFR